jgi:2-keto-4-pentenoate hydratase/2-oxohepta-3-ene-1,7-dioic acid hydratase in catechol pathway
MRVVTFRHETEERLGFLVDDQVVDPKRVADQAGEAAYDSAIAFIRAGEEAWRAADRLIAGAPPAARLALAEVTLAAPMRPSTLLCSGSNYRDHTRKSPTPRSAARSPSSS